MEVPGRWREEASVGFPVLWRMGSALPLLAPNTPIFLEHTTLLGSIFVLWALVTGNLKTFSTDEDCVPSMWEVREGMRTPSLACTTHMP